MNMRSFRSRYPRGFRLHSAAQGPNLVRECSSRPSAPPFFGIDAYLVEVEVDVTQAYEFSFNAIARAALSVIFPSRFLLATAMSPCPCGFFGDATRDCHCSPPQIQRYVSKISGPLLDRIDIHIEVPAVK